MPKAKDRTLVTFLLDRSSSMLSVKPQTISAFNEYLKTLQDDGDKIDFTFLQFDLHGGPQIEKVCVCEPVKKVQALTDLSYQPRGSTPLIDSAYKTIKAVEGQEKAKGAKIVICIQTDGEENSSTSHNWEELKALIADKTKEGWQFNFMGCGIDAYAQGMKMGISAAQTVSYSPDMASTITAFKESARNTRMYAAGLVSNTAYSMAQKIGSGDKYDPTLGQQVTVQAPVTGNLDLNDKADSKTDFSL